MAIICPDVDKRQVQAIGDGTSTLTSDAVTQSGTYQVYKLTAATDVKLDYSTGVKDGDDNDEVYLPWKDNAPTGQDVDYDIQIKKNGTAINADNTDLAAALATLDKTRKSVNLEEMCIRDSDGAGPARQRALRAAALR